MTQPDQTTQSKERPHSICIAEDCDVKILPNTLYCPVHRALKQYEPTQSKDELDAMLEKALLLGLANHTNEFLNPWLFKHAPSHEELTHALDQILNHSRVKSQLKKAITAYTSNQVNAVLLKQLQKISVGADGEVFIENTPVTSVITQLEEAINAMKRGLK